MKKTQLTPDEREAAMKVCELVEAGKKGLSESAYPCYRHKKTGKVVRAMGTNKSWLYPSVEVVAVVKAADARHIRKTPVKALNFQRDYELVTE